MKKHQSATYKLLYLTVFFNLYYSTLCAQKTNINKAPSAGVNYAMSLPGGADGNLSNIAIPALNIASLPVTIEMWYNPDVTQNYYATLLYNRGATSNSGIQYDRWGDVTKIKSVWNATQPTALSSVKPIAGTWNHVALVVTATSRKLYINGVVNIEGTSAANYAFDGITYLGWDNAVTNRTLKGQIDEVRIWHSERTAQELEDNKYLTLTGSEPNLIGYWNFNDQAATATDLVTTNAHNGTINGGTYVVSNAFDPMVYVSSKSLSKTGFINSPSQNNGVVRLEVITQNQIQPLTLTKVELNAIGVTSLSDISNVKVYYTGIDSTFNTSVIAGSLSQTPTGQTIILTTNQVLSSGKNYFWVTYDISSGASDGNLLDTQCQSVEISGNTFAPTISTVVGHLEINSDMFITNAKLATSIVTTDAETPLLGANFVSFQQSAIMTYNGYQYVTYWNKAFHVCIARRKMPKGNWEVVEFTDHTVTAARIADGHYSISMGICKNDGTIHIAFDHHGDNLHYKKSIVGLANQPQSLSWSAASFGAKQDYLIPGQQMTLVTYPRFVSKPNGDLLYEYRYGTSGGGDSYIYHYSAATSQWTAIGKYLDGLSLDPDQNGYINGIHYDPKGRLHVSWVWRETPDPLTNHDVYYGYSDDDGLNWYNSQGVKIGTTNTNPMSMYTVGLKILTLGKSRGLINQESQAVDSKGRIHILQSYLKDSEPNSTDFWGGRNKAYLHHIYLDESGVWHNDIVDAVSRNRSQIAIDENDNVYIVAPNYRVYFAAAKSQWQNWTAFDLSESNSGINEGLIDRESLLNENVLSFVFAQSDKGGKIIVPYYLLEKTLPGKGKGLKTTVFEDTQFNTRLTQTLDSINLTPASFAYTSDSLSVKAEGVLETRFAEQYTLHFAFSGPTQVWINDQLVVETGNINTETSYQYQLELLPLHKYQIRIAGKYKYANMIIKMEWESPKQSRTIVNKSELYATLDDVTNSVGEIVTSNALELVLYPNPSQSGFFVGLKGPFQYCVYDMNGSLLNKGTAIDNCQIGDDLAKGIYFLNVAQEGKIVNSKLVKL